MKQSWLPDWTKVSSIAFRFERAVSHCELAECIVYDDAITDVFVCFATEVREIYHLEPPIAAKPKQDSYEELLLLVQKHMPNEAREVWTERFSRTLCGYLNNIPNQDDQLAEIREEIHIWVEHLIDVADDRSRGLFRELLPPTSVMGLRAASHLDLCVHWLKRAKMHTIICEGQYIG